MPDTRPLTGGAPLLRRPEPVRAAGTHRTPSAPRAQDEVQRPEHLARTLHRLPLRGRRLRIRARTSVGRAASQGPQPRGKGYSGPSAPRGWDARPGRGRAVAPRRESAGTSGLVAVVARAGGEGAGSGSHLALLRQALRPGAHLPFPQAKHGMDDAEGSPPRAGRPVELAGCGRLHAAKVGARPCCGPASAMGAPLR